MLNKTRRRELRILKDIELKMNTQKLNEMEIIEFLEKLDALKVDESNRKFRLLLINKLNDL